MGSRVIKSWMLRASEAWSNESVAGPGCVQPINESSMASQIIQMQTAQVFLAACFLLDTGCQLAIYPKHSERRVPLSFLRLQILLKGQVHRKRMTLGSEEQPLLQDSCLQ